MIGEYKLFYKILNEVELNLDDFKSFMVSSNFKGNLFRLAALLQLN